MTNIIGALSLMTELRVSARRGRYEGNNMLDSSGTPDWEYLAACGLKLDEESRRAVLQEFQRLDDPLSLDGWRPFLEGYTEGEQEIHLHVDIQCRPVDGVRESDAGQFCATLKWPEGAATDDARSDGWSAHRLPELRAVIEAVKTGLRSGKLNRTVLVGIPEFFERPHPVTIRGVASLPSRKRLQFLDACPYARINTPQRTVPGIGAGQGEERDLVRLEHALLETLTIWLEHEGVGLRVQESPDLRIERLDLFICPGDLYWRTAEGDAPAGGTARGGTMTGAQDVLTRTPSLRLGDHQEQMLRRWPIERIRPKSIALGVVSLFSEIDYLRAEHDALAARLAAAEARGAGLLNALEHIEMITRDDMQGFYGYPRTSAADSAHKIAKVAVAAHRETLAAAGAQPAQEREG